MAKSVKRPAAAGRTLKVAPFDSDVLTDGDLCLEEWLKYLKVKQAHIARETGINEGYLSAIKSGHHDANPTLEQLRVIARHLGIPVWALFLPPPDSGLEAAMIRFLSRLAQLKPPSS